MLVSIIICNILIDFIILNLFCFYTFVGYCDGHLLIYSDTHINIFNADSGDWIQTLNLRNSHPINNTGSLTVCCIDDLPCIIYLSNVHQGMLIIFFK